MVDVLSAARMSKKRESGRVYITTQLPRGVFADDDGSGARLLSDRRSISSRQRWKTLSTIKKRKNESVDAYEYNAVINFATNHESCRRNE